MKNLSIFIVAIVISFNVTSQDRCAFFEAKEVSWYGIDFTGVRMVGPDFTDPKAIKDRLFNSWNYLIMNEVDKYDLKSYFNKDIIHYQLEPVIQRNQQVDETKLVTLNTRDTKHLTQDDVKKIVSSFDFGATEGYGMLLVADIFNKVEEMGYYYLVVVDLKNKDILLSEQISGKTGGFGFRNYWARTYYNALQEAEEKFPEWLKEACN